MILAAGLGTRMRPLTERLPKPLLPLCGRPQLYFLLEMLHRAGVDRVVINLHHLGDKIRDEIGTVYKDSLAIDYSEEPHILGTGGGLGKVRDFFENDTFLLLNADVLMDLDLNAAVRRHTERCATATMVVREWLPGRGLGRVEMNEEGRILRILGRGRSGTARPVVFTGVHILNPAVFRYIRHGVYSCINRDCYPAMLAAGEPVYGTETAGYWRDTGTPADYLGAHEDFFDGVVPACYLRLVERAERHPAMPGVTVVPPVHIGKGCVIGEGSRVGPYVVLGDGCRVGRRVSIKRLVALDRTVLPDDTQLEELIVSPWGRVGKGGEK
jgi:NDP-sugar pyrophosphorylase family protein